MGEVVSYPVCEDKRASEILRKSCEFRIEDKGKRMRFLESVRSIDAFEGFADVVLSRLDLSDRKFTGLYPGSGSHIAPIILPARLMDRGEINSAEMIFTDIDYKCIRQLIYNLEIFTKVDDNFKMDGVVQPPDYMAEGEQVLIKLKYRGKSIVVRFLCGASGEDWFRDEDFARSDVFISHDPGEAVKWPVDLFLKFMQASKSGHGPRFAIMEDLRRMDFLTDVVKRRGGFLADGVKRRFDLELLGGFVEGSRAYGHRRHVWGKGGIGPAEVGKENNSNAVLIELYPQLKQLSSDEMAVLLEVSLMQNQPIYRYADSNRLFQGKGWKLHSWSTFGDIVKFCPKVLSVLKDINPVLASGFALRVLQNMFFADRGTYDLLSDFIRAFSGYKAGFDAVRKLIDSCEEYIEKDVLVKVRGELKVYRDFVNKTQEKFYLLKAADFFETKASEAFGEKNVLGDSVFDALHQGAFSNWWKEVGKPFYPKLSVARDIFSKLAKRTFERARKKI